MVFNPGIVNRFWRGREQIFYLHSHITFALFEFKMGSLGYGGWLLWAEVQKRLKTTALKTIFILIMKILAQLMLICGHTLHIEIIIVVALVRRCDISLHTYALESRR